MPIQFRCNKCNALLHAKDGTEGKNAQCKCGAIVPIPNTPKPKAPRTKTFGRIIVKCAACNRRIQISERLAGKKMRCTCGAYIQIESLPPSHPSAVPASTHKTPFARGLIGNKIASALDELTPLDWSPKQVEQDEKLAFEEREEKVLMSYILKDRERRNPAVAFGLMVLMSIVNFSFAVAFWLLAWFIQASPGFAEKVQEMYPIAFPDRVEMVFLVDGLTAMLTAVFVLIPFSPFWWIVAFILSTSTSLRVLELIHHFWTVGFEERVPRAPFVTLGIVAFMAMYFFSQDARDYFRMRLALVWAALIVGSVSVFVFFLGLLGMMLTQTPAP